MDAHEPEKLHLDTTTMTKLADDLGNDARDFRHGTRALRAMFGDDGPSGMAPSKRDDRPYGADPRNVPAEAVMAYHDRAVKQAVKVIRDINVSLRRSGPIAETVVGDLGSQDTTHAGDLTKAGSGESGKR